MMPVSNRDCCRTDNSRLQLCSALVRSKITSGNDLNLPASWAIPQKLPLRSPPCKCRVASEQFSHAIISEKSNGRVGGALEFKLQLVPQPVGDYFGRNLS